MRNERKLFALGQNGQFNAHFIVFFFLIVAVYGGISGKQRSFSRHFESIVTRIDFGIYGIVFGVAHLAGEKTLVNKLI